MKTITVPAIRAFVHEGRAVPVGGVVSVTPVDASVLAFKGLVSLDQEACRKAGERVEAAAPVPERVASAPQEPDPPVAAPAAKTRRRRRSYQRRDLVAEP